MAWWCAETEDFYYEHGEDGVEPPLHLQRIVEEKQVPRGVRGWVLAGVVPTGAVSSARSVSQARQASAAQHGSRLRFAVHDLWLNR